MEFEGATRPDAVSLDGYESIVHAHRYVEIPSTQQQRVDYYANGQEKYIGWAPRGLLEDTNGWLIHYVEYDANDRFIKKTVGYHSWSDRANADYQ